MHLQKEERAGTVQGDHSPSSGLHHPMGPLHIHDSSHFSEEALRGSLAYFRVHSCQGMAAGGGGSVFPFSPLF